jgi:hypothetical protein
MNFLTILRISLIVCFISISTSINAQTNSNKVSATITYGTATDVGMSDERLARIDSMCMSAIEEGDLPGIVALVARNGKIVYNKAF